MSQWRHEQSYLYTLYLYYCIVLDWILHMRHNTQLNYTYIARNYPEVSVIYSIQKPSQRLGLFLGVVGRIIDQQISNAQVPDSNDLQDNCKWHSCHLHYSDFSDSYTIYCVTHIATPNWLFSLMELISSLLLMPVGFGWNILKYLSLSLRRVREYQTNCLTMENVSSSRFNMLFLVGLLFI